MKIYYSNHPEDVKHYTTQKLRENFLIENIFQENEILLNYTHVDRMIFGGANPIDKELKLDATESLRADFFLQRRELGAINIGGEGSIIVDGKEYILGNKDAIYIGLNNKEIIFKSINKDNPAKFYINSSPAHKVYETKVIKFENANHIELGSEKDINRRTLHQYLHPTVLQTCQLSMGITELKEGNGWNTMPSHTHERRMEVYFYFNFSDEGRVFHLMGEPKETRHIVVAKEQALISPSWSIHSGVGTESYSFIWGMCGENQDFDDMDHLKISELF